MTFRSQIVTDLSVFFDTDVFATAITYTPNGGSPNPITAILHYGPSDAEKGLYTYDLLKVKVKLSDVALPDYRDKITVPVGKPGAGDWYAQEWKAYLNESWEIICRRDERPKAIL